MPGRQPVVTSRGASYEGAASATLSRIASVVPVPREQDFGVDFYCLPRVSLASQTETVAELCAIQVKGGEADLSYGGMARGEWRQFEIEWLKSLAVPLYLARIPQDFSAVELYSLWPVWVVIQQSPVPFEIRIATRSKGRKRRKWQAPTSVPSEEGRGKGDGKLWRVDVGPPFLRLTQRLVSNSTFASSAASILRAWIGFDRLTVIRHMLGVGYCEGIGAWATNGNEVKLYQSMSWNFAPGANIETLIRSSLPAVANLGVHLQWQNNPAAYSLVPFLEWVDSLGLLNPMIKGLLTGLKDTQAQGRGPGEGLADQVGTKG